MLPFIGITVAYLAVLIGFYVSARKGYAPSGAVGIAAIVAVAVLGVPLTEIASILWLTLLQRHAEVTANLFVLVPTPIVAVMVAIQALVLAPLYRLRPLLHAATYLGIFTAAYAFLLSRLFNPPGDIAGYVVVILVVGSIALGLVARFVWRRPA